MNQRKSPTMAEFLEKIGQTFNFLDSERTQGLQKLRRIHSVKNRALQVEKFRLMNKHRVDSEKIAAVSRRLSYAKGMMTELNAEIERSRIVPPRLDKNSWGVHGLVRDSNKHGVEGLTVSFFIGKRWVDKMGYACTDKHGYFSLTSTIAPEEPAIKGIKLTVTDKNQRILFMDDKDFTIRPRQLDYRIITLSGQSDQSVPPESGQEEGEPTAVPPDTWIVRGQVVDRTGEGISNMIVQLDDKAGSYANILESTITDEQGEFRFNFTEANHPELFQKRPTLKVIVRKKSEGDILSQNKTVAFSAGRQKVVKIELPN